MSAQIETSSELRTEDRRAVGAAESKWARRSATNWNGAGTEKRADLSLFRIP